MENRRQFVKKAVISSMGLVGGLHFSSFSSPFSSATNPDLIRLSQDLLNTWGQTLLKLQITDKAQKSEYGGILCPARQLIHGRIGDAIYPFLHIANKTNNHEYLDAAHLLYIWMENNVSQADGSWLNEPVKGSWKGTTVFAVIALCEALKYHSSVMDPTFKKVLESRLQKAGNYLFDNFSIEYGNINYPISASYALSLLGTLLDIPKFRDRGTYFAKLGLNYITKTDGFIYGEGDLFASKRGSYAIDLGYNVEETLPFLVLYGLLNKDEEVLQAATRSLKTHMEFMLPDGGWDNSWGTRNFKWSYWGSRTTDGCQPAYALLAERDPAFYRVALKSTELLQKCTKDGLLYGGLHYVSHNIPPSVHHTFCHMKALATILDHQDLFKSIKPGNALLPRERNYGSRFFPDIQTRLISKGKFKATITTYDKEYKKTTNGHATGGALTLLWHEKAGPLLSASMNEYQMIEADNMQKDTDPLSMPLTPRVELRIGDALFMNISDLNALAEEMTSDNNVLTIKTRSKLVDKHQQSPALGDVNCEISYVFSDKKVILKYKVEDALYKGLAKIIVPIISKSTEKVLQTDQLMKISKSSSLVKISSNRKISIMPTTTNRVFNFVPGLEAIPLTFEGNEVHVEIEVI